MHGIKELFGGTIHPIIQERDNVLRGGVHTDLGSFVEETKHIRWGGQIEHTGGGADALARPAIASFSDAIYGGVFFNHFGHFLTESLGRLWPVNAPELKSLPILVHSLWGQIDLEDETGYHAISLKALGIDPKRVRFIQGNILVSRLLVPEQHFWYSPDGAPDSAFVEFLSTSQSNIENQLGSNAQLPKKLYVSRIRWNPARGIVIGEAEFETFLSKNGYTAIYPENLNYQQQLEYYTSADLIIFAEGSAMHGCILLPQLRAKVAVIKRRPHGPRGMSKVTTFNFMNDIYSINEVDKHVTFGMKDWSGVSYVNYASASRSLASAGFLDSEFEDWISMQHRAERFALSRFVKYAADYEEFINYMIKVGSPGNTPGA